MSPNQLKNADGVLIAWVYPNCEGENPACTEGHRSERPVHLIPAHTDPRTAEYVLALPDYHFATVEQAHEALEKAWNEAEIATTFAERDDAYARGVPVKIRHDAH
jgi:hypothetical protein